MFNSHSSLHCLYSKQPANHFFMLNFHNYLHSFGNKKQILEYLPLIRINLFIEEEGEHHSLALDKGLMGPMVNPTCTSINGGVLQITSPVPFKGYTPNKLFKS